MYVILNLPPFTPKWVKWLWMVGLWFSARYVFTCEKNGQLSIKCREKRRQLCHNNHLVNQSNYMDTVVKRYLNFFLEWLVDEVAYYSAFDVELDMREYYE